MCIRDSPLGVIDKYGFINKHEALINIHFPQNQEKLTAALNRLKYEELFFIQLQLLIKNIQHKQKIKGYVFEKVGIRFNTFFRGVSLFYSVYFLFLRLFL